jgi:predicted phosphodiesterase
LAGAGAGALAHGKSKNVQRIFCGHTHEALSLHRDGLEYYNSGSWTQDSATYLAVDNRGVRICEYTEASPDAPGYDLPDGFEFDFEDLTTTQASD